MGHADRSDQNIVAASSGNVNSINPEDDRSGTVGFMDPEAVLKLVDKPEVSDIGREVRALLQKVCTSLKA